MPTAVTGEVTAFLLFHPALDLASIDDLNSVADGLHLAFLAAAYYHYTVTSYGMYLALARPHWTLLVRTIDCHLFFPLSHLTYQSSIFPGVIVSYSVQMCASLWFFHEIVD